VDEAARGARTLVISTDPAPSLGDALGLRLTGSPRPVPLPRGSLHALVEALEFLQRISPSSTASAPRAAAP
jgi:anion-transporting  ArsA/GET3 family ATPase